MPSNRLSFDQKLFILTLLTGAPGVVLAVALLVLGDSSQLLIYSVLPILLLAWLGSALFLRRRFVHVMRTISNLLEALKEGDFSMRGRVLKADDALGELVWEINELGRVLRSQRFQAMEAGVLLEKVIAQIDIAVLAFDDQQQLCLVNPSAARLFGDPEGDLLGRPASELGLSTCLDPASPSVQEWRFPATAGKWRFQYGQFRQHGMPHHLLVISDLSQALREQERQAWQKLIRVLGHELNNSLTPIRSMAQTLAAMLIKEPRPADWETDTQDGLSLIGNRAESLGEFIGAYSKLARLPSPVLQAVRVSSLVEKTTQLAAGQIHIKPGPDLVVEVDSGQIEQALINLQKNAEEAAAETGGKVEISWHQDGAMAVIEITDEGPGVAGTSNLFTPFFTTKKEGTGIGLVLTRQIVESHSGRVTLVTRADRSGCLASVSLPLENAAAGTSQVE